jgi:hypothetical protein
VHRKAVFVCVPEYLARRGTPLFGASLGIAISQGSHFWDSPWIMCGYRDAVYLVCPWILLVPRGTVFGCVPEYSACTGTPFFCVSLDTVCAK